MYYWDEPEEKQYWICYCEDCDWESEPETHRDDLSFEICPECQSDNVRDKREWL